MARPTKLTKQLQQQIGENVALGLTYALAAAPAGITYQTFNDWLKKGKNSTSGEYFEFTQYIQKCNADTAKKLLERLNEAAKAGNCTVCMWILSRRFPDEFGRRVYRKTNVVSENHNVIVDMEVNDADKIREKILEKFDRI
jgi:AraC-like DNA-binding protein